MAFSDFFIIYIADHIFAKLIKNGSVFSANNINSFPKSDRAVQILVAHNIPFAKLFCRFFECGNKIAVRYIRRRIQNTITIKNCTSMDAPHIHATSNATTTIALINKMDKAAPRCEKSISINR